MQCSYKVVVGRKAGKWGNGRGRRREGEKEDEEAKIDGGKSRIPLQPVPPLTRGNVKSDFDFARRCLPAILGDDASVCCWQDNA